MLWVQQRKRTVRQVLGWPNNVFCYLGMTHGFFSTTRVFVFIRRMWIVHNIDHSIAHLKNSLIFFEE